VSTKPPPGEGSLPFDATQVDTHSRPPAPADKLASVSAQHEPLTPTPPGEGGGQALSASTLAATPVAQPHAPGRTHAGGDDTERWVAEADAIIGTLVGERYQVLQRLGHGGMGAVYLARHTVLDSQVAIKVLLAAPDAASQERFLREAKLASKVSHPNTVYISDFGVLPGGQFYLVMELLRGKTLADELVGGPLSPARACQIALQIACGLEAVHEKGIIHRDLKPSNIAPASRRRLGFPGPPERGEARRPAGA